MIVNLTFLAIGILIGLIIGYYQGSKNRVAPAPVHTPQFKEANMSTTNIAETDKKKHRWKFWDNLNFGDYVQFLIVIGVALSLVSAYQQQHHLNEVVACIKTVQTQQTITTQERTRYAEEAATRAQQRANATNDFFLSVQKAIDGDKTVNVEEELSKYLKIDEKARAAQALVDEQRKKYDYPTLDQINSCH